MKTLHIEDHGQDFLEWDIDNDGIVVECRPFQNDIWKGTRVMRYRQGDCPLILPVGFEVPVLLNYQITAVQERD
jgi:hypothetical protein